MAKTEYAKGTNVAGKVAPGMAVGDSSLGSAVGYLKEQHPEGWADASKSPQHEQRGRISPGGKLHSSEG